MEFCSLNIKHTHTHIQSESNQYYLPSSAEGKNVKDLSRIGIYIITFLAFLIGIWGVLCLIAGIANSNSPCKLVTGWISAVFGL
ncbi:MAG TPA: hypothetical protein DDW42_03160 [Desulfobacteraceae bacterium]|nr:hypothetical protein [Desulfobacteraceae bacterium]